MLQPNELVKNLRPGQTVYKVYALGEDSFIETVVFQRIDTNHSQVRTSMGYWLVDDKDQVHSLHDMNAHTEPNNYNMHKLCNSRESAERYKFLCVVCCIGGMQSNDWWEAVGDEDY